MGDALCNGRINWLVLLIPLVYLVLAAVPLLCCPRAFGRGQGDVFARSVLVAVPIGLVPAVEVAYFASDAAVIASLSMGSAIAVAAFVCTLLREKRDNNSDTPRTSDPFDAGVFSPALSPREEQFVRLLLKGKTPAEIARETGTKPSTVRTTLHRAYGKASVAGSRELVALFAGEGDATGPGLLQRHAGDMLTSVRTRRLFRYLLTTFFILLAAGPLVMADSDWGSGVSRAVAFSLASYALGLGLLLSLHYAGEKLNREVALIDGWGDWARKPVRMGGAVCRGMVFCLYRGMEVYMRSVDGCAGPAVRRGIYGLARCWAASV